jgi:hypothetical protein
MDEIWSSFGAELTEVSSVVFESRTHSYRATQEQAVRRQLERHAESLQAE